jgi:hypothetical protein
VGLGEVLGVVLGETLHRMGLGEVLGEVLGETLHRVGLGEFLGVVLGETAPTMTWSHSGSYAGEEISLHLLEIRPKEVRLCNLVYNICST